MVSSLVYYEHLWFNARQSAELETNSNTVPDARLTSIEKEEEIIFLLEWPRQGRGRESMDMENGTRRQLKR